MSNNLNAILWLLCLGMMQLEILLPSDPKELERELRKSRSLLSPRSILS